MARTLKDLATDMRGRFALLQAQASQLAINGALAVVTDLVQVTPVDTSEALSNWQVTLDEMPTSDLPPYVPGQKGSTAVASETAAIAAATEVLKAKQPGEVIYITNLTPYIVDLDQGSSQQFPGGFIPRALLVFQVTVESTTLGTVKPPS